MSYNCSRKFQSSQPSSPVYLRIVKDTNDHLYDNKEEIVGNHKAFNHVNDKMPSIDIIRRPRKPGVNVATSKLMGKKKISHSKRFRSMSPLCFQKCDQRISDSKSAFGTFGGEKDSKGGQLESHERKNHKLFTEEETLRNQFEKEQQSDDIRKKCHPLRVHEDRITELKQELNHIGMENRSLRQDLRLPHGDKRVEQSNELIQTLIETQLALDRCEHQMKHLFDHLKILMKDGYEITICDINRIKCNFHETQSLLCEFKRSSSDLRLLLKDFQQQDLMARESLIRVNSFYKQKQSELAKMNDELQSIVDDKTKVIFDLRKELSIKNDDSLNFASTQESLESVKGHLQQQLKLKSGDCNRMAVQIRILESELIKERSEKEHFMSNVKKSKDNTYDDRDTLKKAARAQKQKAQKAEKTIDELSSLISEKEKQLELIMISSREIENLQQRDDNAKEHVMLDDDHDNVILSLKKENENLRLSVCKSETRLKMIQAEMETLRQSIGGDDSRDGSNVEKLTLLVQKLEDSEKSKHLCQSHIEELERKVKEYENSNIDLHNSLPQKETIVLDRRSKADDLVQENAALIRQLEAALLDSRRNTDKKIDVNQNSRQHISSLDRSLHSKIPDLESQLAQQRIEANKWRLKYEENERKSNGFIQEIKLQLETAETKNISMDSYIKYLKKSYTNVFGDMPLSNGLGHPALSYLGGPMCF